jgi:rRNA maturation RNase YbeY
MVSFNYEYNFKLNNEKDLTKWIGSVIKSEGFKEGVINYIFCDDDYLLKLNQDFLNHDTFTDIISFDYTLGKEIHGDIFISIDRVFENAKDFQVDFQTELHRVMVHGVLHYCGHNDKTSKETQLMRLKENHYMEKLQNLK